MVTVNIADAVSSSGQRLVSATDATDETPYLDPETWHSVARVFTASTSAKPTYVYTDKIKAKYINVEKLASTCSIEFHDSALDEIADYDGQYGIGINSNIDGYDFVLVLEEEAEGVPTSGNYADDKIVLFSGYNRTSYAMDFSSKTVMASYTGIEELLNEIRIDVMLEVNHAYGSPSAPIAGEISVNAIKSYNRKVIFNENSKRDYFNGYVSAEESSYNVSATTGQEITATATTGIFDKTGLANTSFWSCYDILEYLLSIYVKRLHDINSFTDQFERAEFARRFVKFDQGSLLNSDLSEVYPYDFDLTGVPLLDAIYEILDKSRLYSVTKRYNSDGVAVIGLRANDKAQRATDNSRDIPMKLPMGEANASAVKLDIHERGNINLNRENKSVGRVIVRGGNLYLNTLSTTWGVNPAFPLQSDNKDTASTATNAENFSTNNQIVLVDYTESEKGVPAQTYSIINTAMIGKTLNTDLGMTLSDFNETEDQNLFENEKLSEIDGSLFRSFGDSNRTKEDIAIYVAFGKENGTTEYSPVLDDSGTAFMYIQPVEGGDDDTLKMSAKYKTNGFAEFILYSSASKKDDGRSAHKFKEYIDNSTVSDAPKYPQNSSNSTSSIPLYIRCAIKTDYRLRGIAKIAGYDASKHRTLYIDSDVSFGAQFKDKTFDGNGGWDDLTDGFIGDGTQEKIALAQLQSNAEATLLKYTTVGNSGYSTLAGVQSSVMVGDMVDEFTGTGRNFDFEAVISKVGYDLELKKTVINYGADFERV